uniref:K7 n=1 Tax=Human herpesvirus 8 TaxID=37296 RepID=A0A7D5UH62_HHV8|nr:K7 [Human gammaherpesvirus 8]QLI55238.1 K7 [Human gammaherpesvirus 8]QLI55327.1 K7 [Human gammaherpesvirus 8]
MGTLEIKGASLSQFSTGTAQSPWLPLHLWILCSLLAFLPLLVFIGAADCGLIASLLAIYPSWLSARFSVLLFPHWLESCSTKNTARSGALHKPAEQKLRFAQKPCHGNYTVTPCGLLHWIQSPGQL